MQDGYTPGEIIRDWETHHRPEADRWVAMLEHLDGVPMEVRRREQWAFIAACQEVGLPPEEVSINFIHRYAEQAVGGCEMATAHTPDGARRILEIAAGVDELLYELHVGRPLRSTGRARVLDQCAITLGLKPTHPDVIITLIARGLSSSKKQRQEGSNPE